jgi:archaellum component FlaC
MRFENIWDAVKRVEELEEQVSLLTKSYVDLSKEYNGLASLSEQQEQGLKMYESHITTAQGVFERLGVAKEVPLFMALMRDPV